MMLHHLSFALALSLFVSDAFARCDCRCIDGQMQAACTVNGEVPPICSQQFCAVQPSITPIGPADTQLDNPASPGGLCETVMVTNPRTGRLQPRQVCR